jgi:hypothetical protein
MSSSHHDLPAGLGYSPKGSRGYAMYPVEHSPKVVDLIETLAALPQAAFVSPDLENNPLHNGVVKAGGKVLGPHFTLQYSADLSRLLEPTEGVDPDLAVLVAWRKLLTDPLFGVELDGKLELEIVGVKTFSTPAKEDYPAYCCVALEIKSSALLLKRRRRLYETLPSFDSYPDYTPHVTVGYFLPEYAGSVSDLLKGAIGEPVTISGDIVLDMN